MQKLIKGRFWILLVLAVLLWGGAFFSLSGLTTDTSSKWEAAKKAKQGLDSANKGEIHNQQWIDRIKKLAAKAQGYRQELWRRAWESQNHVERGPAPIAPENPGGAAGVEPPKPQLGEITSSKPIVTWPTRDEARILYNEWSIPYGNERRTIDQMDFGEPITTPTVLIPVDYQRLIYRNQFDTLLNQLKEPLDLIDLRNRTGSVRFGGGGASTSSTIGGFGAAVRNQPDNTAGIAVLRPRELTEQQPRITGEEAWLLQEELSLKRELLMIVKMANDYVGRMQPEWREMLSKPELSKPEEKKEEAAGEDAAPEPMAPEEGEDGPKEEPAKPAGPEVLDARRFLNTTWQIGVEGIENPQLGSFGAWMLDLELVQDGDKIMLRGRSYNASDKVDIPAIDLIVWVAGEDNREDKVVIPAGEVPRRMNTPTMAQRDIAPVQAPLGSFQIKRVQRVPANGDFDHQRFQNPYWLVDVRLVRNPGKGGARALQGVLYNRGEQRMRPVPFEASTAENDGQSGKNRFEMSSRDPINAGDARTFFQVIERGVPEYIDGIRQIFDWKTVPVKEIRRIEIGEPAHLESDRTKIKPLKEYEGFKTKNPNPQTEQAATDTSSTTPNNTGRPGGLPGGGSNFGGRGGGVSTSNESGPKTEGQGVPTHRYVEVTTELRRIPVAMVLVVDQAHINDVLAAMGNSRLRIQVTMNTFIRVPNLPPPPFMDESADQPGAGNRTRPGAGVRAGGPAAFANRLGGGAAEQDSSLVELQVYGEAIIYENPEAEEARKNLPKPEATAAQ